MKVKYMDGEGTIIILIIGYIIALVSPIIWLIYGSVLFYFKKDVPLYRKHGRFIIYFAIAVFIAGLIITYMLGGFQH